MSLIRMMVTSKVTVTHVFKADEVPTDAAGSVTATVQRLDGTSVATGTATHGAAGSGAYSWDVTRAVLDSLTLDFTGSVGGSTVTARDYVEVVGGFLFDLGDARSDLGIPASVTSAKLAQKRIEVEQECERICRRAFVPRFARAVVSGNGTERLALTNSVGVAISEIRTIRSVTVNGTAVTGADLAAINYSDSGVLTRPDGVLWPAGVKNVVVEVEHGWDYPPEDLRDAGMLRLRSLLPRARSGIPDRATSFVNDSGATYRLSLPTKDTTGIPDVDGTYLKYARARRAVTA
jgi:hypothetical protein